MMYSAYKDIKYLLKMKKKIKEKAKVEITSYLKDQPDVPPLPDRSFRN